MSQALRVAYFSMEIGLEAEMPTYAGGLGILAGDTIRSAADLRVPMVAVTLLHRGGYFDQTLDASGRQREAPARWHVEDFLQEQSPRVTVRIEGRLVVLRAWERRVIGITGSIVSVYFLDCDLPENSPWDRALTGQLYGDGARYRLCQEVLLGIGGVRILHALGCDPIEHFHMNEGHASLLALELLDEAVAQAGRATITQDDIEAVRRRCIFTTHTPVPAGHDQFPIELVTAVLGRRDVEEMRAVFCCEGVLNMTFLALNLSHRINGVAKKHSEISRLMFAHHSIESITNGVHAATWVSQPFGLLFDRFISEWKKDNFSLRYALGIPRAEVWQAHANAKLSLIEHVNRSTGASLSADIFTIGFARRATGYKRADLFFGDLERLRRIAAGRKFQIIYAGKAHPLDESGKAIIQHVFRAGSLLRGDVPVVYLENYDLALARLMTAGADLWLNTPEPPQEASGTSGMKAALNGVPSLSVLDGWWLEGWIEGVTGWAIGGKARGNPESSRSADEASLYDKLEHEILPLFYDERDRFVEVMRHAIALNGSFFNTQRMVQQYVLNAYFL